MAIAASLVVLAAAASSPDLGCSGPDNWAATSAYAQLKNAGMLTPDAVDFAKTRVELFAQQKIGKDLYRQVHRVAFTTKAGPIIRVITLSNASSEECSMSSVRLELVTQVLGAYP